MDFSTILSIISSQDYDTAKNNLLKSLMQFSPNLNAGNMVDLLKCYDYDSGRIQSLVMIIQKIDNFNAQHLRQILKTFDYDDKRNDALKILISVLLNITSKDILELLQIYDYDEQKICALNIIRDKISNVDSEHLSKIMKTFDYDDKRFIAMNILTPKILSGQKSTPSCDIAPIDSSIKNMEIMTFVDSIKNISTDKVDFFKKNLHQITIPNNINDYCGMISASIENENEFLDICKLLHISEDFYSPYMKHKEAVRKVKEVVANKIEIYDLMLNKQDLKVGETYKYDLIDGRAVFVTKNFNDSVLIETNIDGMRQKVTSHGSVTINENGITSYPSINLLES